MSFWYKERKKIALWWNGISRQEIHSYVYTAVLFLFLTFLYFMSIHISGLFSWYRFQRSMMECFIMLFLTQLMTGKNMLHPFWRIGYIPFALWITIFPYCLIHAPNGSLHFDFNHITPYFLTAFGVLLLLFFMMNIISRAVLGKKMMTAIVLAMVGYFSFSPFIYLLHYLLTGLALSPRELFFASHMPWDWITQIVYPRIGATGLLATILGMIVYLTLYCHWIWKSAYHLNPRWKDQHGTQISILYRLLQLLVFAGCLWLLVRWSSECFPMKEFNSINAYEQYLDTITRSNL